MGAAEWTGYNPTANTPSSGSVFPPYSPTFGYEAAPDHHGTLHLPTVLPTDTAQPICPTDYNATKSNSAEFDTLLPRYDSNHAYPYNWSNSYSYNNYSQYNNTANNNPNCSQGQYLNSPTPAMVLYPHLYSTVNQNQIHVHLHGSADKLDHYLSSDGLTISSTNSSRGIEIGLAPTGAAEEGDTDSRMIANVNGDPSSVWRPY